MNLPGHKGKKLLFIGKYSGYLVTSNDRKGNAGNAEGNFWACFWPDTDSPGPEAISFHSCFSPCQAEGSPASQRSDRYLENIGHLWVIREEHTNVFSSCGSDWLWGDTQPLVLGGETRVSSGHQFMLSWYLVASGWHQGSFSPGKQLISSV